MTIVPFSAPDVSMNVDGFFGALHDAIPRMTDDELIATYEQAQQFGRLAWEVEAHCLWVAKQRKAHHNDGAIIAVANGFQVHKTVASKRIRVWAAFGTEFLQGNSSDRILTEFAWYEKAAYTTNPRYWLAFAEDKKASNPFYIIRTYEDDIAAAEQDKATREAQPAMPPPAVGSRYGVIVADPPWLYEQATTTLQGTTGHHYRDLSIDDLCTLPVASVAAKDAILLLWCTWPQLTEGLRLIEAWGFKYVTGFPWIKIQGTPQVNLGGAVNARPQYGVGFWTRGCSEPILIARRGNVSPPNNGWVGLLSPNFQHSRKPENLYDFAESIPGPYCELFARRTRKGWTSLGNEIDGKDIRAALEEVVG